MDHRTVVIKKIGYNLQATKLLQIVEQHRPQMELLTLFLYVSFAWLCLRALLLLSKKTNLPPGPTGLPIVGCLFLLGKKPNESLAELAKTHGPLMTLRLGFVTTVVASSAEMAREILHKNDHTISGRVVPDAMTAQPNCDSTLAWVSGNMRWRNRRRICTTSMFTNQRLDAMQGLRQKKVKELVDHIRKNCLARTSVDVGQISFATTMNLISNTIFSVDLVDPKFESAQEFKDLVWRIMEDGASPNLSDYFPLLRRFDLQGLRHHINHTYVRLHEIFDDMIDKRLKSRATGSERKMDDFLDVLLDQCQEDGSDFNRHTIKPLFVDLFVAGTDTTSVTVEWAMTELLRNPDIMKRTRNELIEIIGKREVEESDMNELPYLQAVVKETLRLHPAAPLLLPYKAENVVELCGYRIPKNCQVIVNAWAIGRDAKYWENPTSFVPERFMESSIDYRGRDFEYIPFGAGRRICPGLPLAIRMVPYMLASLLHSFHWKLPEGITPENLDMQEDFGITLKKAVPLRAVPIIEERVRF